MDKENQISQYNSAIQALSKRTGKFVTALYMVTNYMEDNEAIKTRLRTLGVDLVSQVSFAEKSSSFDRGVSLAEASLVLSEIETLFSIAGSVALISEMNTTILLNACSDLKNAFEVNGSTSFGLPTIDRATGSFVITKEMLSDVGEAKENTHTKNLSLVERKPVVSKKEVEEKALQKTQNQKPKAVRNNRTEEVLKVVRLKGEVSVKDICENISDCSEKTIQRELLSLVEKGLLKKTGEKRWSKYSLA